MAKINAHTGLPFNYGTRSAIDLLVDAMTLILKHRTAVAEDVPDDVNEQINGMITVLEILKALNPPGPR